MTITEGQGTSTIRTATLRGCELTLLRLRPLLDHPGGYLIQLDRHPATYTRALTGAELVALARLNPDDGMPDALLPLLADLTLALTLVAGEWAMLTMLGRGEAAYACTVAPPGPDELATLGRLASELLAAVEVAR